MFDIYNEARRLNEILAEHKFGPRWVNDAFLFGVWCYSEGKGDTTSCKLADEYAKGSENYNRFSKEDYTVLCTQVKKGRKRGKDGYTLKSVDFIEIDKGYLNYLEPLERGIRNMLFTILVWGKVKEKCGMVDNIIYYQSDKPKLLKQAGLSNRVQKNLDADVLNHMEEIPAIKYAKKNVKGVKGYRPIWDKVTETGEVFRISGNTELGYAYGDYMDDDIHNPGRVMDIYCNGMTTCETCGKPVPKFRQASYKGKAYCPEHLVEIKMLERLASIEEKINDAHTEDIDTFCRICGKSAHILKTNKMWEKALTGNYICEDCRRDINKPGTGKGATYKKVKVLVCTSCGREFKMHKGAKNYSELVAGTNCECGQCFRKTLRYREKLSKLEKK